MTDLILHHYGMSPFSEKVRRLLAFKRLPFRSVRAPAVMPKPDLVALTGGYRRIPVLQIGADVYVDTSLIARVFEERAPEPTLYPSPLSEIVAHWADTTLFETTVPIAIRPTRFDDILRLLTPDELAKMGEDRQEMWKDSGRGRLSGKLARATLPIHLGRLDAELARRPFLFGDAPCIADFSVFHSVWFLESNAPEPVAPFENLKRWSERLRAYPLDERETIPAEEALRIAREATPAAAPGGVDATSGLAEGERVVVRAADYGRDPVLGALVALTPAQIVVRREDPRAGTVNVHFPRVGYEVAPEGKEG